MVQVVLSGYYYIGGSRNCLKEGGGAAFHDYFCPPFGLERRDYSTKNNHDGGCNRSICGMTGQWACAENKDKSWF